MASRDTLIDGDFVRPTQVGPRRYTFPFLSNGDRVSCYFEEDYWQTEATFAPGTVGVSHESFRDFILIAESPPIALHAGIVSFTRTWSRVPATQTIDSTIMVAKPSVGLGSYPGQLGSYIVFKPDSTLEQYDAYFKQLVTNDGGAGSTLYPSGGTYTLSFGAGTTGALAYDSSNATVQTALNALSGISDRGGVTVSGSYNSTGGLVVSFATKSQISIDSSSLSGGTIVETETSANSGYSQVVGAAPENQGVTIAVDKSALTYTSSTPEHWDQVSGYSHDIFIFSNGGSITGGTYRLTVSGVQTAALAYNASHADIESALNALGIGTFSVWAYTSGPVWSTAYANGSIRFVMMRLGTGSLNGTFTLTALGQTTGAIAANASASTVQTALNALSNVSTHGGVSVSGDLASGYSISFSNASITASGALLAPSGASATVSPGSEGATQTITFSAGSGATRALFCEGHGFALIDPLYVKSASGYFLVSPGTFSVPNNDTVLILSSAGTAYTTGTITEIGKRTRAGYTAGSVPIPCSLVTRFSTSAITPEQYNGDDVTLLQAIFAGTTSINYRVGDSVRWPFELSPIRSLTTTQISASNL
jgi:hypothetical protein